MESHVVYMNILKIVSENILIKFQNSFKSETDSISYHRPMLLPQQYTMF